MKKISFIIYSVAILVILVSSTHAKENNTNCGNRYLTLVNPVRGRKLWSNQSLKPLQEQYGLVNQYNFSATWLLQYDVLLDDQLINEVKKFDSKQEFGVFLEVSEIFAHDSRIIYPYDAAWFSPRAVFLSGYKQSDRRKLIDSLFTAFRHEFGFYPKSVGAWWIDSYSLNYLKEKYNIKSAMIVADQKNTDNYGVWGQWWGVAYYPAKTNILTPASTLQNKQDLVVIQWAQRDPELAWGEGYNFSNYSLQANDYKRLGKTSNYFSDLSKIYLSCDNHIGQITVGLETGIESVTQIAEYEKQLQVLKNSNDVQAVTMSQFSDKFRKVYPTYPEGANIQSGDSIWNMNIHNRSNKFLGEYTSYKQDIAFSDYFIKDSSDFLDRRLIENNTLKNKQLFPSVLIMILVSFYISYVYNNLKIWSTSVLFSYGAFGLILKSNYLFGWEIYYGPIIKNLAIIQGLLILITFIIFYFVYKLYVKNLRNNSILFVIPFCFGFDHLISLLRFSHISGFYYFGIAVDQLRFIGITISNVSVKFINQDMPSYQAAALLRFSFGGIWDSLTLSLIIYPLMHIVFGLAIIHFIKNLSTKIQKIVLIVLFISFACQIFQIYYADPRNILPIQ